MEKKIVEYKSNDKASIPDFWGQLHESYYFYPAMLRKSSHAQKKKGTFILSPPFENIFGLSPLTNEVMW